MGKKSQRNILGLDLDNNSIGWALVKWSDVLEIVNGKNQKAVENKDGKYPIYGSGGVMNYANDFLCPENTTIVGRKGTINKPILVREKFWNVDTAFGIVAGKDLNPFFLNYFCQSFNFLSLNKSTTLPSLAKRDLKEIEIPLPPLPEQRAIVAKLDALFERIDTAIALVKENIAHTEALMGSVLDEEFGWLENDYGLKRMDTVVNLSRGHNPPKKNFIFKAKEGYVRFLQIRDGSSDNYMTYVPDTKKLHKVTKDDLLLVAYRHVGKVFRNMEGAFNVALCKIENKDESLLNMTYLYHCVSSRYIKGELLKRSERALIPSMSIKHLEKIKIPFPPIEIQNNMALKFEKLLSETELLKKKQSSTLSYLEGLKQSLLDVAFKGELV